MIVGGGAAGLAAADMLRREGYEGPDRRSSAPTRIRRSIVRTCRRTIWPAEAQDDWIPLWPSEVYAQRRIELLLGLACRQSIPPARTVLLEDGLAPRLRRAAHRHGRRSGAAPDSRRRQPRRCCYLRSFADSRAIVERAPTAKHVVVVGASFIGLEVAASLRTRGIAVDVVAPEARAARAGHGRRSGPLRSVHSRGARRRLSPGRDGDAVDGRTVTLSGGATLDADFVVMGVGVQAGDRARRAARASRSIAASPSTSSSKPACPESSRPAMSRAGPIRTRASAFASSTGSWPSVRVRSPRATCWAGASASTPCRSSGASTTT